MIDSSIPLQIKSPQVDSPVDSIGRILQLRNVAQAGQLQQANLQRVNLENSQAARQAQSEKDLADLIAKNTRPGVNGPGEIDHHAVEKGLAERGHGTAAVKYGVDRRAEQRSKIEDAKKNLELNKGYVQAMGQLISPIVSASADPKVPAEKLQEMYQDALGQARKMGIPDVDKAPPNVDLNWLRQRQQGAVDADKQIDNHQKELDYALRVNEFEDRKKVNAPKALKDWEEIAAPLMSAAANEELWNHGQAFLMQSGAPPEILKRYSGPFSPAAAEQAGMAVTPPKDRPKLMQDQRAELAAQLATAAEKGPDALNAALDKLTVEQARPFLNLTKPEDIRKVGLTAEQAITTARQAETAAETKRSNKAQEAISGMNAETNRKRYNATLGAGLDESGRPLPPEDRKRLAMNDPTAVAIANYQIAPPSNRSGGAGKSLYDKVLTIDPTYDATKFPTRNKIALDFSAGGASGKAMTATDTALAHLHTVSEAGRALETSDLQILNKIAQSIGAQTGSDKKIVYDTIVSMVAPEISKAVIGAAGGQEERESMKKNFSSSVNQKTRDNTVKGAVELLGTRYKKQAQAYEADMGKPLSRQLSPESQAMLEKYSGGTKSNAPKKGDKLTHAEDSRIPPGDSFTFDGTQWLRDKK